MDDQEPKTDIVVDYKFGAENSSVTDDRYDMIGDQYYEIPADVESSNITADDGKHIHSPAAIPAHSYDNVSTAAMLMTALPRMVCGSSVVGALTRWHLRMPSSSRMLMYSMRHVCSRQRSILTHYYNTMCLLCLPFAHRIFH